MLDQNTDRMWYVIGALVVGAGIILLANKTLPEVFASVTGAFEDTLGYPGDYMPPNPNLRSGTMNEDFFIPWAESTLVYKGRVSAPDGSPDKAHHIVASGGSSNIKAVRYMLDNKDVGPEKTYTNSIYVKNTGDKPFEIFDNINKRITVKPGETTRYISTIRQYKGDSHIQIQFLSNGTVDALYWYPKIENGEYATAWVP